MTETISTRQLLRQGQSLLKKELPSWKKYKGYGLYRRTEDFVQWIVLDPSSYESSFRIHYAVQALAERFPVEALTLGDFVRSDMGGEFRVFQETLLKDGSNFTRRVISQIKPLSSIDLTARIIDEFLAERRINHVASPVAQGIAKIMQGQMQEGRLLLEYAIQWYTHMEASWAQENMKCLQQWISADDMSLLQQLKQAAQEGGLLLRLT